MHIIAGSQNGRVLIYDCRNITEPVYTFQAHKTTVRHVAFQRTCDKTNSSSMSSMLSDLASPVLPNETQKKISRTSDLFGFASAGPVSVSATETSTKRTISADEGDSFLAALGIDGNSTHSVHNDSVFSKSSAMLPVLHVTNPGGDNIPTPNSAKIFETKRLLSDPHFSSTPKVFPNAGCGDKVNEEKPVVENTDMKSTLKELFQEEMDQRMEEINKKVDFNTMHVITELRRNLFDLQLFQVKQFVYMQKVFETMKNATAFLAAGCDMNKLIEENEQLKMMNKFLEEQLKNSMVTNDNKTEDL
ncbi:unnamed protein product [Acanthoscelides obtectus]|uniref:Uncharacterized protein n=1 Tax=Acanthoscelides obtectus TaxID=200917 RepID=A0A9P0MN82_ACAOB|nr:unnamed protein product [Acanthoscelides obtectus]CAK1684896.1 hypothetical protein AOBTE_LOCUS35159 [Acanthoscelides obtectus]